MRRARSGVRMPPAAVTATALRRILRAHMTPAHVATLDRWVVLDR